MPDTLPGKLIPMRFLLLLVLYLFHSLALSQNLIMSQEYLEDKEGSIDVQELETSAFTAFPGSLSQGYSASTYWIRIKVQPHPQGKKIKLRIRPTFLDEVTLYEPVAKGSSKWITRTSGDRYGPSSGEQGMNSIGFTIHPDAPFSIYYLRVNTINSMVFDISALSITEAAQKDALLGIWHFAYMSFILFTLGWGLLEFLRDRKLPLCLFVLYQCDNLVYAFSVMGYMTLLEPRSFQGISDTITNLSVLLLSILGSLFHLSFIHMYQPQKWLFRISCCILFSFTTTLLILFLIGYKQTAMHWNMFSVLTIGVVTLLLALSTRKDELSRKRTIKNLYILIFITTIMVALPLLGTINVTEWKLQSGLIHGLIATALVFYTLWQRSKTRKQLLETSRIKLAQQKHFSEQQERFLNMLTHEIKTPLMVATMNLDAMRLASLPAKHIRRSIHMINQIIERTRLSDLIENRHPTLEQSSSSIRDIVQTCIAGCEYPQRIHARLPDDITIMTDPAFLSIIIANLIDNALKYGRENSTIHLSLAPETPEHTGYICLYITNEIGSAGVPDQDRIFEKYYRNPQAQSISGSGLGLYLSSKIATMLRCRIAFQTTETMIEARLWIPA